jgi:hypothetical protein
VTAAIYALPDRELLARCIVERCRAGGPGGQHLARTESAVRIVHPGTGLEARCQDHRDRLANQGDALKRLRLRLALHLRGVADPAWVTAHRRGRQLPLGPASPSYPLVVAAALDALAATGGELVAAAASLGVSSSQLARLLTADKEVRAAADALRRAAGRGPIHG